MSSPAPSLVTISSGVFEGAGANFPPFPLIPLTFAVVLNTLWHYRVWHVSGITVPECDIHCVSKKGAPDLTSGMAVFVLVYRRRVDILNKCCDNTKRFKRLIIQPCDNKRFICVTITRFTKFMSVILRKFER